MKEAEATTLMTTAKLHHASSRADVRSIPLELEIDPLYSPLIEAAERIRQKIEAGNKEKIESVKRETAEQTETLYHRLTEAREEFKKLEVALQNKDTENKHLQAENQRITQELQIANENAVIHLQEAENLKSILENADQIKSQEAKLQEEKNSDLIERLKSKIEQINNNHDQQLQNIEQKLNYVKQMSNTEIKTLKSQNESVAEELERSHSYIKELEEKNNALQKELFENWIHKDEEL